MQRRLKSWWESLGWWYEGTLRPVLIWAYLHLHRKRFREAWLRNALWEEVTQQSLLDYLEFQVTGKLPGEAEV